MPVSKAMFSSKNPCWATPPSVFNPLDEEFCFDIDVCASNENAKCSLFYSEDADGLSKDWGANVCWMNPPYGREISRWMRKAYESSQQGATVVCLVPARTDTAWWHDYAMKASEIRYVRGRIKFVGAKSNAPFPSAIVIFKPT